MFPEHIQQLAKAVIAAGAARQTLVATAESCTGGLVSGALTGVSGSSAVLDRGFVTYSNEAKIDMLGVQAATLTAYGAVSRETALEMATGAAARSRASVAVAITGIAGPGGGSTDKPVGLVHFATTGPAGARHREERFGDIGRDAVRLASVEIALTMLLDQLQA